MIFFSKQNLKLQYKIEAFFQRLAKFNENNLDGKLSIILLGSLSRGEATWTVKNNRVELLSDIEFFTVYPSGFSKFIEFDAEVEKAACLELGDIKSDLFHIDNTWVEEKNLSRLERKLLTYDAQECGITVVGRDVKNKLPKINIKNINLEDIKDILIHRIFFVLYYGEKVKNQNSVQEYRYLLAKNSLDLMTVLLANEGILVSGFRKKLQEIQKSRKQNRVEKYFLYCLKIKQCTAVDNIYDITDMEEQFIELIIYLNRIFKIPLLNRIYNVKAITRRHLGMIKRGLKVKNIAPSRDKYLEGLIDTFRKNENLSKKQLLDNYVINGYPKPEK